jgi:3-phosphoglycerate kinase
MTFFYFAGAVAIAQYGIEKNVGYISTGGGAFLEVLDKPWIHDGVWIASLRSQ